jgi:hypothetical protein
MAPSAASMELRRHGSVSGYPAVARHSWRLSRSVPGTTYRLIRQEGRMFVEPIAHALSVASIFSNLKTEAVVTWAVFILCWLFSLIGVGASFLIFGPNISGYRLWGISVVIAIAMISLSYGQKYSTPASRISFTPVDLISYLIQGFLWPTTWPALAQAIGVGSIQGPVPPPKPVVDIILHVGTYPFS